MTALANPVGARAASLTTDDAPARPQPLVVWWPAVTLGSALLLWVAALARLRPDAVGEYGLISAMPVTYFAALVVVTAGIAIALARGARLPVVVAHATLFALIVHATPAITYGTLRYAWAWRHIGIVELMMRGHQLKPSTPVLPIYQSWPGFFAGATTLTESGGLRSALSYASWAPVVFEVLNIFAMVFVLRSLTSDRRRIALAVWLFLVANWVGQDYFAPQAFAFFLYLLVIGIVLRWFGRPATDGRFKRRRFARADGTATKVETSPEQRRAVGVVLVVLMAAVASSHPLTPIMLSVALLALLAARALTMRWPAFTMLGLTVGWMLTGARDYVFTQGVSIVSQFGQVGSNVDSNISNVGRLAAAQQLVATMGRMVVVAMAVLAVVGVLRRASAGYLDVDAVVLCMVPAAIFVGGSYGGEAVFRVYLFALPFAAYLSAGAFYRSASSTTTWRTSTAVVAVTGVLLTGFMFGYYGKEQWFRFTPSEVRAARIVYETAPPNSNVIVGTPTFPTDFAYQERYTTTPIANEPEASLQTVLRDPVNTLYTWMTDPRYARSYLIITRSQIAEAENTGLLPKGALERIERQLLESDRFDVLYHDHDAVVFATGTPFDGTTP